MVRIGPLLLGCAVALSVSGYAAAEPPAANGVSPLAASKQAIFWGSPEDSSPRRLGGVTKEQEGRHYVASNEGNLNLFYARLKNRGGGYAGVGTDQAYLFIGWQRPELAWLTDYDPVVREVHRIHHAFFRRATTPDAMLEFWTKGNASNALKVLAAAYPSAKAQKAVTKYYRRYRAKIRKRLLLVRDHMQKVKIPCYLTDQATYDFVRGMIQAKRIRPLLANLLSTKGFAGVAKAAKELGVPIRVLYVSNAEQYWKYSNQFRKNMEGMFTDDKSVLARTLLTWKRNKDYRYILQPFGNFVAWLKWGAKRIRRIIPPRRDKSKAVHFRWIDKPVPSKG